MNTYNFTYSNFVAFIEDVSFPKSPHGFFKEKSEEQIFAELAELKIDILLVAMGVP